MKRKLAAALFVAALSVGVGTVSPASSAPDRPERSADYVSPSYSRDICHIGGVHFLNYTNNFWGLTYSRTIHYGSAHVTQCEFWYVIPPSSTILDVACYQYVWGPGVARPYWDQYPDQGTGATRPYCW